MYVCLFVDPEEKADPSIPLYVLPLYSLLDPEQQAKVREGLCVYFIVTDLLLCLLGVYAL